MKKNNVVLCSFDALDKKAIIRLAKPSDLEGVLKLLRKENGVTAKITGKRRKVTKRWVSWCRKKLFVGKRFGRVTLCAEIEGSIQGIIIIEESREWRSICAPWNVTWLLVAPEFRRKGIGKRLMIAGLIESRKTLEAHKFMLTVAKPNKEAIKLYEHCGFECVALLKDYRKFHEKISDYFAMKRNF